MSSVLALATAFTFGLTILKIMNFAHNPEMSKIFNDATSAHYETNHTLFDFLEQDLTALENFGENVNENILER